MQGFVVGKLPLCLAGLLVKFAVAVRGVCVSIKFTLRACGVSKFATIKKRKALNFVILGC